MRINLIITYEQDNERNVDVEVIDKLLEIEELKNSWIDVKNGNDGVNNFSYILLYQRDVAGNTPPPPPRRGRTPQKKKGKKKKGCCGPSVYLLH